MIYAGENVIDDSTPADVYQTPEGLTSGLMPEFRGVGKMPSSAPFPKELLIPRNEWEARIKEMEERKSRVSDLSRQAGQICKNQGQTNYCWINCVVYALETQRVIQNQGLVSLSPASGGAIIKNFQNVGGWPDEALEFISTVGVVPTSMWPDNSINRAFKTVMSDAVRKKYRVPLWWELPKLNLEYLMSALLHRIPVAVGYLWWGHAVCGIDPVWTNGQPGVRIRNSWGMDWGFEGYSVLQGQRALPDCAVSVGQAVAS